MTFVPSPDLTPSQPAQPLFDSLEPRLLLNSAPEILSQIWPNHVTFNSQTAYSIGIDASDTDGDALSITAQTSNPNLVAVVRRATPFATLHFVKRNPTTGATAALGNVLVQLFPDDAPLAVNRFRTLSTMHVNANGTLSDQGDPFYKNSPVHRIMPNFMIQSGSSGTGQGSLGDFADEFVGSLGFGGHGVLAMANPARPDSNDSGFFITEGTANYLQNKHTVFGQLISGWEFYEQVMGWTASGTTPQPDASGYLPTLGSVTFHVAGTNLQDGTVSLYALNGWQGEATVTITVSDGQGGEAARTVNVKAMDIAPHSAYNLSLGQDVYIPTQVSVAPAAFNLIWDLDKSASNITVSQTATDWGLNVNLPDNYHGAFHVTALAKFAISFPTGNPASATVVRTFVVDTESYTGFVQPAGVPLGLGGAYLNAMDIEVVGNLMFVAAGADGVRIYDVSDPTLPVQVGSWMNPNKGVKNHVAADVEVVGTTAFVAMTAGGLVTLDVSNPAYPTIRQWLSLGTNEKTYGMSLTVRDNVLFVSAYASGLIAYNISNPANITRMGSLTTGTSANQVFSYVVELSLVGPKYGILSDRSYGYVTVDLTDPANMKTMQVLGSLQERPWGSYVVGNRLYLVDGLKGTTANPTPDGLLAVIDISNINSPKIISTLTIPYAPQYVTVLNETAVVGTSKSVVFVNLSNEKAPAIEYTLPTVFPTTTTSTNVAYKAHFAGGKVFVPTDSTGALLFDSSFYTHRKTISGIGTVTDSAGTAITVYAIGATAHVHTTGLGTGDITYISFTGTTASTVYLLASKKFNVGGVKITGSANMVYAPNGRLTGDFTATGTVASVTFADALAGTTLTVGPRPAGSYAQLALAFGAVQNLTVNSQIPISMIYVADWQDDGARQTITAPSIGTLYVTGRVAVPAWGQTALAGAFQPNLALSGTGYALTVASIAGPVSGTWNAPNGQINSVVALKDFNAALTAKSVNVLSVYGNITGGLVTADSVNSLLTIGSASNLVLGLKSANAIILYGSGSNLDFNVTQQIGVFSVYGSLSTSDIDALSITSMTVMGDLSDSTIDLTRPWSALASGLGYLYVRGFVRSSDIRSSANVGVVYVGGLDHANVLVSYSGAGLPASASAFANANATLTALAVLGVYRNGRYEDSFIASNVVAPQIVSATTNYVQVTAGQTDYGLAAAKITVWVGQVRLNGAVKYEVRTGLTSPDKSVLTFDDFLVRVV